MGALNCSSVDLRIVGYDSSDTRHPPVVEDKPEVIPEQGGDTEGEENGDEEHEENVISEDQNDNSCCDWMYPT